MRFRNRDPDGAGAPTDGWAHDMITISLRLTLLWLVLGLVVAALRQAAAKKRTGSSAGS